MLTYINFLFHLALGLTCHHCMGNLTNPTKLCTTMEEYVNETCMGADAYCATTELQSNISVVKAYARGCVNVRTNISHTNCNNLVLTFSGRKIICSYRTCTVCPTITTTIIWRRTDFPSSLFSCTYLKLTFL